MKLSGLSERQVEQIEIALQRVPFVNLLGLQLDAVEPGLASMTLTIRPDLLQNNAVVHGGAIASLIDTTAAFATIPMLDEGETSTTVDLTITYLRPLTVGVSRATARILRRGSKIIVLSVEVLDHAGNLAATGLTTYLRLPNR